MKTCTNKFCPHNKLARPEEKEPFGNNCFCFGYIMDCFILDKYPDFVKEDKSVFDDHGYFKEV